MLQRTVLSLAAFLLHHDFAFFFFFLNPPAPPLWSQISHPDIKHSYQIPTLPSPPPPRPPSGGTSTSQMPADMAGGTCCFSIPLILSYNRTNNWVESFTRTENFLMLTVDDDLLINHGKSLPKPNH